MGDRSDQTAPLVPAFGRLPDGFTSSGDPVPENPFPADSALHLRWADATSRAEVEIAQIRAEYLRLPEVPEARSFEEMAVASEELLHRQRVLIVNQFNVWAWRGANIPMSDQGLRTYVTWLVAYANSWLELIHERMKSAGVSVHSAEKELDRLRSLLGAAVQDWKAKARQHRDEMVKHASAASDTRPSKVTVAIKRKRRALVQSFRSRHDLTVAGFARQVGISESAIRGIINEDRSRYSAQKQHRLLEMLGVSPHDWYKS